MWIKRVCLCGGCTCSPSKETKKEQSGHPDGRDGSQLRGQQQTAHHSEGAISIEKVIKKSSHDVLPTMSPMSSVHPLGPLQETRESHEQSIHSELEMGGIEVPEVSPSFPVTNGVIKMFFNIKNVKCATE